VLPFVASKVLGQCAHGGMLGLSRDVSVESERALLVANSKGKRLISAERCAARFIFIMIRRKVPRYGERSGCAAQQ